ncbi:MULTISPECIES: acetylglutamate kinase [unclassified Microbacterium]|jgi:acetylglutamate kinase|uniref:acetylglutamate kinase n=1 Tax=Microbacterium TaxID=33882 RepID=UPI000C394F76|nr:MULTISPECIES: acetylglutamate kinase [unclassified Microbacterium]MBU19748.1 acetylglutamate kinase [Microbacterium sp.]HAM12041.1 acetylglutamate kinase [Microbacterium sp.]HCM50308.1 acetylglutamate kinase [Microbacterium sp.]HCU77115.1 acetylglutamate kinase [Microbacterium sp.]HIE61570.1 acetylglutamate kinase [Microbacterium sp.]|tara:strand:- start:635 stop:1534 length:900 start_codon:yes stop_codon:yes gene_type:complete
MTDLQETTPDEAAEKAAVLIESLPWLKRFRDQIVVVKYGGNAMVSEELQRTVAEDIAYLRYVGVKPVVVHGGGPQISRMLERLDIPSEFQGGYRVTNTEAISVVRMVLTGHINPQLVSKINAHGPFAAGLSGEDAGLFGGRRRGVVVNGEEVDLGSVGDVVHVNPTAVLDHLAAGRIPVVSSIAPDLDRPGHTLNVNADAAAAALAVSLNAAKLVILTDVPGLYADWPNRDSLVSHLSSTELRTMLPTLESGMVPKMQACLDAVDGGVDTAAIIDGRVPHSLLIEVFTSKGIGTEVVSA